MKRSIIMSLLVPHNKLVLQAESCLISRPQIHCLSTRCRDLTASRITEWLSPLRGRQLFWIIWGMWSRNVKWSISIMIWYVRRSILKYNSSSGSSMVYHTGQTMNQHPYLTIYQGNKAHLESTPLSDHLRQGNKLNKLKLAQIAT